MDAVSINSKSSQSPYSFSQKEWSDQGGVFPSNTQLLAALSFLILRYTGNSKPSIPFVENGKKGRRSWCISSSTTMRSLEVDFSDEAESDSAGTQELSTWNPIFISCEDEPREVVKQYLQKTKTPNHPDLIFIATPGRYSTLSLLSFHTTHEQNFLDQMLVHWMHAVHLLETQAEAKATTLPILLEEELQTMTVEWNDTSVPSDDGKFDFEEFDLRAQQVPNKIAISSQNGSLTYAELHNLSNQMARYLQNLGVEPEVIVGIYLPRSIDFVVSLVGLTKSGGAFLPIDPDQTFDRKEFMIKDSEVPFIICSKYNHSALPDGDYKKLIIEDVRNELAKFSTTTPDHGLKDGNMSYLFYTSGSTGEPKGVCMTHTYQDRRNAETESFPIKSEKVLLKSSTGFTVVLLETFTPIKAGGEIVVVPKDLEKDASWMIETIQREQVETLNLVPSMLSLLIHEGIEHCTSIKKVLYRWRTSSRFLAEGILQEATSCKALCLLWMHRGTGGNFPGNTAGRRLW